MKIWSLFQNKTYWIGAILTFAAASPAFAYESEGYMLGKISDFQVRGLFKKSGEGSLMVGKDSSLLVTYKTMETTCTSGGAGGTQNCTKAVEEIENPIPFSIHPDKKDLIDTVMNLQDPYVVMKFHVEANFSVESSTLIDSIKPVNTTLEVEPCRSNVEGSTQYSAGTSVGRIVKIENQGPTQSMKSLEVKFQAGDSGNQFVSMSVLDSSLRTCLSKLLVSGKRVKVSYTKSAFFNPLKRQTEYNIVSAEPIE